MQERDTRRFGGSARGQALAAVIAGAVGCAMVYMPWHGAGPTPIQVLWGESVPLPWLSGVGSSAVLTVALLLLLPGLRRIGWFGAVAAGALAGGLPAALLPWLAPWLPIDLPGAWAIAGVLLGAVLAALSPLLRERGLLSLLLVPALAAFPALWAFRAAILHAEAAAPLVALQAAVPLRGPIALAWPDATDPTLRAGMVAGLRRPWFATDLDVWSVTADSPEQEWLRRMGVPLVRVAGAATALLPELPRERRLPAGSLRPEAGVAADASELWIRAGDLAGGGRWTVFTPLGALGGELDEQGNGRAAGPRWQELLALRERLRPLQIRVLVVSRGAEPAYGWLDLSLP